MIDWSNVNLVSILVKWFYVFMRWEGSEEEELFLKIHFIEHFRLLQFISDGSHGCDLLLVVAGPASVAVGSRVVRIIELAGAGVHVAGSLRVKIRVASRVVVACSLALRLGFVSPHLKHDTLWCFADALVVSVLSWRRCLVVASPSTIAISSWVSCIVEFTGTGVHVSLPFSKQERLASGVSVAVLLAPSFGLTSPHVECVSSWWVADALGPVVLGCLSHSNSIEACPAAIAIASWVMHIIKFACSRVHVPIAFGIDEWLAVWPLITLSNTVRSGHVSPCCKIIAFWRVAQSLTAGVLVGEHSADQKTKSLHLKRYLINIIKMFQLISC